MKIEDKKNKMWMITEIYYPPSNLLRDNRVLFPLFPNISSGIWWLRNAKSFSNRKHDFLRKSLSVDQILMTHDTHMRIYPLSHHIFWFYRNILWEFRGILAKNIQNRVNFSSTNSGLHQLFESESRIFKWYSIRLLHLCASINVRAEDDW